MSQSANPFLFAVHFQNFPNVSSTCIITELKALGVMTGMLTAMPERGAFDKLTSPAFPLFDGKTDPSTQEWMWSRVSAGDASIPPDLRHMPWCYKISPRAAASPENMRRTAEEIKADVHALLVSGAKKQSAVRAPAYEERQSMR